MLARLVHPVSLRALRIRSNVAGPVGLGRPPRLLCHPPLPRLTGFPGAHVMIRALCLLSVLTLAIGIQAQSSGAVYTSNKSGSIVNGNVYKKKTDVYLNGGPGPNMACSNPGLVAVALRICWNSWLAVAASKGRCRVRHS